MAGKRSLEIKLKNFSPDERGRAVDILEGSDIDVVEARARIIQVRNTTPTTVRRLLKDIALQSISEGFSR